MSRPSEQRRFQRDQAMAAEWQLRMVGVAAADMKTLEGMAADVALVENPRIFPPVMQALVQQADQLAAVEPLLCRHLKPL